MFPSPYPPFVFNAVAAVGAFEEGGPQAYANPVSPWFNVFLGLLPARLPEETCGTDRSDSRRRQGIESEPYAEDLVRLGKSDWNFFSNWDYGVPEEYLLPYCSAEVPTGGLRRRRHLEVAGRWWRRVELRNVEVASCYESDDPRARGPGIEHADRRRHAAGASAIRVRSPTYPNSFIPKQLDAVAAHGLLRGRGGLPHPHLRGHRPRRRGPRAAERRGGGTAVKADRTPSAATPPGVGWCRRCRVQTGGLELAAR